MLLSPLASGREFKIIVAYFAIGTMIEALCIALNTIRKIKIARIHWKENLFNCSCSFDFSLKGNTLVCVEIPN